MCHCLRIHPSGFYAWLKEPLSERAKEDVRQIELIRKAWKDSGRVYRYPSAGRQAKRRREAQVA